MRSIQLDSKSEYYDNLPYNSYSFFHTHPARLSALAKLFSLEPPSNKTFRLLELGSASGGNIIPLAIFYPEAELVGVDYSKVQVEQGLERIKAIGLEERVQLLCKSITDIEPELGEFDYIVCHGVYSWVPSEVQDAIFKTIQKHLKPNGIAYVSYNTYPGWKRLEILRDMMIYHTRMMDQNQPLDRIAQGRAIVEFIRQITPEHSAVRQMIDEPWEGLRQKDNYYLAHEFLESVNQPCYFYDFAKKLEEYDLFYLADAEPSLNFMHHMPEDKMTQLIQASHSNQVMLEQYLDFIRFCQFRRSIIVHQEAGQKINRQIPIETFGRFQYSIDQCEEEQPSTNTRSTLDDSLVVAGGADKNAQSNDATSTAKESPFEKRFNFSNSRHITAHNEIDYAILKEIESVTPQVFTVQQLVERLGDKVDVSNLSDYITNLLNRLVMWGMADIWDQLPETVPHYQQVDKPYMPEKLRNFYKTSGHLSNYRHSTIVLNIIQQHIVELLDGEHTAEQLHERLREAYDKGDIRLLDKQDNPLAADLVDNALGNHLSMALNLFKVNGLLYEAPAPGRLGA